MSDLIDRQAAIKDAESWVGINWYEQHLRRNVVEWLKELPSAQPEIVRCKDCDWWTKQEDSLQGRCALLQMYPAGGWFCGNARRREVTE